jgi:TolB protein
MTYVRSRQLVPFLYLVTIAAACIGPALAQEPPAGQPGDSVTIRISDEQGVPKYKIALAPIDGPAAPQPEAARALEDLEATLRNDLELSGVFDVRGPETLSVLRLSGDRAKDLLAIKSLDNDLVVFGTVRLEGERLVLEGRLYDVSLWEGRDPGAAFILGKSYRGTFDLARLIAHTFSDEILYAITGRRGIALTSIAFTSDRDGGGIKELYLMDYDGVDQRRLSAHQSLSFSPAWSPSGDGLAYVSYYRGGPSLFWVDRASGAKSEILVDDTMSTSPSFSPDGRRIAFSRSVGGNPEIFVVDRDGSNLRQLTSSGGIDANPAWSPDGTMIAFTSSRAGSPQLYSMRSDGSEVRRLTLLGKYNDGAAWHPDGTRLTFAHRAGDGSRFDIAVVELATQDMRILTAGPGSHEAPIYSPDGRFIAYESSRAGGKQIFLVTADGEPVRQLTTSGNNYGPSWSPYLKP